jgi:hypothetical protein
MITTVHDSYTPFYFSSNLPNGLRLYALMSELLESVVYYFSKSENCSIYIYDTDSNYMDLQLDAER